MGGLGVVGGRGLLLLTLATFWAATLAKLVYVEENLPLPGEESPPGSPWPLPRKWTDSPDQLAIDPATFIISSDLTGCDVIDAALHRYQNLVLIDPEATADPGLTLLPFLNVSVTSGCDHTPHLKLHPDYESYTLEVTLTEVVETEGSEPVSHGSARLVSHTVWGALRGLETFSQLVHIVEPENHYRLNVTLVEDAPRFPHRGLLLDTARHFLPKGTLLEVLDSMAWNKFNVLHWHIVDDQSFPYESRIFPNLTEGAYTPRHVYTQRDVMDIVEYARYRGIRVIPEFDTPGHTQGFGKAFPHLLTPCYGDDKTPGTPSFPFHAAYENLDPTNPQVYDFLKAFLVDLKHTFVDGYIHLGLDEVFLPCWSSSPVVRAFMARHNYTEVRQVERHYVEKVLELADRTPINYITWQDPADRGIQMANTSVVQVWKDVSLSPSKMRGWRDYVHDLTEAGHQVILSSCWYINFITYGQDWKNFYNCDPTDFQGTDEQKKLVLGGEAAMWGEYVDATNIMPRLWPRASAAAERLWSLPLSEAPSVDNAAYRLDQHRCRMLRRGIPAQPILNGYCGEWEVPQEVTMSTPPPTTTTTTTTTTPPPTTTTTTPSTTPPTTTTTTSTTTAPTTSTTTTTTTTSSPPTSAPTEASPPPPTAPTEGQQQPAEHQANLAPQQSPAAALTTSATPTATPAAEATANEQPEAVKAEAL
ncbi:beta-hexosaminidase subunit beta-like [Homarus americanus]|uniref:beta-N-acetylhexosaminidase n=1 Tax=Homarus americanus TaxID=6706 RepID=A0A8J5MJS2_HOMAM|nr:beta-hexosaminidase subunit beta-like [Homarus americanus]KAG7154026.1 Beta-hexosaminidase subunit beta-like [Homarus americanus]